MATKRTRRTPPHNPAIKKAARERLRRRTAQVEQSRQIVTLARIQEISRSNQKRLSRVGGEWGASGTQLYDGMIRGEDHNRIFEGRQGVLIYDEMERSDAQIGTAIDLMKLPLRGATREIQPPKDKPTDTEKTIAEACHDALFGEGRMAEDWDFYYRHLLMRIDRGFGFVEKVWFFDEDSGLLRWQRLAPRLPRTVNRWLTEPNGRLKAIEQYVSFNGRFEYRQIPADYAVLSVREREGDNYFGKSVLRRLWKHWFYKDDAYRIDGVRLDRYGVGIPMAEIDPNYAVDEDELGEVELMLQAMRSNERGYIMTPSSIKFSILTPNGEGGATGLMDSVNHHNLQILRGVLATFMSDNTDGMNSNKTRTLADIFLDALDAEDRSINGDITVQLIRPFCDMNFDMTQNRYPRIVTHGIKDIGLSMLSEKLPLLVTATLMTPTDDIEALLRDLFGLAPLPEGLKRGDKKPEPKALPPGAPQPGEPDPKLVAPEPPPDPNELSRADLDAAVREIAEKIAASAKAPVELDVEDIIRKTLAARTPGVRVKSITRDKAGRILRIVTSPAIELYTGQPREHGGQFGKGKLVGSGEGGAVTLRDLAPVEGATVHQTVIPPTTHSDETIATARSMAAEGADANQLLAVLGPAAQDQVNVLFNEAPVADAELGATLNDIAAALPSSQVEHGPIKGLDRALQKVVSNDTGNLQNLRDVVRASVAVDTPDELDSAVSTLHAAISARGGEIVASEDRFTNPTPNGYRDLNLNVKFSNGVVGEVQVHMKSILQAKNGPGHELYVRYRALAVQPQSTQVVEQMTAITAQSRALYDAAWKNAGGK